jgi:nucleoside 2-deoxyribosyltransferase
MIDKKIYLAIPYSGHIEKSFRLANEIAAELIQKGFIVFSPISMSHPIAIYGKMKGSWDVWKRIDMEFIKWCDEVIVINFDNSAVEKSIGVQAEIDFAKELGKPVKYYY